MIYEIAVEIGDEECATKSYRKRQRTKRATRKKCENGEEIVVTKVLTTKGQ